MNEPDGHQQSVAALEREGPDEVWNLPRFERQGEAWQVRVSRNVYQLTPRATETRTIGEEASATAFPEATFARMLKREVFIITICLVLTAVGRDAVARTNHVQSSRGALALTFARPGAN